MKGTVFGCRLSVVGRIAAIALLVILMPQVSMACPVCYGDSNDPMVQGTNKAVWIMLAIVGFVQIGFVALFWSFWKRAKELRKFRDQFHVIPGGR